MPVRTRRPQRLRAPALLLIAIAACLHVAAAAPPLRPGINTLEPFTLADGDALVGGDAETILVPSSLDGEAFIRIPEGARVTLRNLTLWAGTESADAPLILVEPGARLLVEDCRLAGYDGPAAIHAREAAVELRATSFLRTPRAVRFEGAETSAFDQLLRIEQCEFLAPGERSGALIATTGGVDVRVGGLFVGGGEALRLDRPARVEVTDALFAAQAAGALIVRHPRGEVHLERLDFEGSFSSPGIHLIGDPAASAGAELHLVDITAQAVALRSDAPGFVTILAPEAFAQVLLRRCDLRGQGPAALRVVSRSPSRASLRIEQCRVTGWIAGLDVSSSGAAELALHFDAGESPSLFIRNESGILAGGTGMTLSTEAGALHLEANRTGLRLGDGASGDLRGARVAASLETGVAVESGARLRTRAGRFEGNHAGVHAAIDADRVDLGASGDPGGNLFSVPDFRAFAIVNESGRTIDAHGNEWHHAGQRLVGHAAIDDLIADGDDDNPTGEHGRGAVLFEATFELPEERLEWNLAASRRTPGYGRRVFRTRAEIEPRLAAATVLHLGPGTYPMLPVERDRAAIIGAGPRTTTLLPEQLGTESLVEFANDALRLEGLTLSVPTSFPPEVPLFAPGDQELALHDVVIDGAPDVLLAATAPGPPIRLSRVQATSADAATSPTRPLLDVAGRDLHIDGVRLRPRAGAAALVWRARDSNEVQLSGDGLRIDAISSPPGPMVVLQGDVDLAGLAIEGPVDDAVRIETSDTTATVRLTDLSIAGFRRTGIDIAPGRHAHIEVLDAVLLASSSAEHVARGIVLPADAEAHLAIDGLRGEGLRPALALHGRLPRATLSRLHLELPDALNSIFTAEDGILLDLRPPFPAGPRGAEPILLLDYRLTGYDNGIHVAATHDDPATVTLGSGQPRSAGRVERNGVGLRLASPRAIVAVREHVWGGVWRENGVAVLVENGALLVENARMIDNQLGLMIRGGDVDLGGGPMGSAGGNRLWPQAGALAVVNETPRTHFAIGNEWGEAVHRLRTTASPIRDRIQNPAAGPVIVREEDVP